VTCGPPITTGDAGFANSVSHAIRARNHSRHRTDADEAYLFATNEAHELLFVHRARIAID
jgi:hypothetical protein